MLINRLHIRIWLWIVGVGTQYVCGRPLERLANAWDLMIQANVLDPLKEWTN